MKFSFVKLDIRSSPTWPLRTLCRLDPCIWPL